MYTCCRCPDKVTSADSSRNDNEVTSRECEEVVVAQTSDAGTTNTGMLMTVEVEIYLDNLEFCAGVSLARREQGRTHGGHGGLGLPMAAS